MDFITIIFLSTFAAFALLEAVRPGRRFPRMRWWRLTGLISLAAALAVSTAVPLLVNEWLYAHQLFDLTGLGIVGGAIVGIAVFELVTYWWHRALHRVPALWRIHQMHHSSERIDIYSSFWFHPIDIAGFTLMGSIALVLLVGVRVESAIAATLIFNALALFQHANINTPPWLGWIVQRPENHALHHERGVHAHNYGSFSLWDIVFGTFKNPRTWNQQAGFYDGASRRVPELLAGLDVTTPPKGLRSTLATN